MEPFVFDETEDFAVVYKPPRMHSTPKSTLRQGAGDTLLDWYLQRSPRHEAVFPSVTGLSGGREGGMLHRLDYETQGLVLFAKNQKSLDHLLGRQDEGKFIKEYHAVCLKTHLNNSSFLIPHPSFPPPPYNVTGNGLPQTPFFIESFFRPFGPGRKQVRPVIEPLQSSHASRNRKTASDQGLFYRTEITGFFETEVPGQYAVTARIYRGFRHQIRCHLAWIGCPVLNDPLYGQESGQQSADGFLALRATGLSFTGPDGKQHEYRLP